MQGYGRGSKRCGWSQRSSRPPEAKGIRVAGEIVFKEESYRIVGACFEVYRRMGNGFLEAVYQECLAIEFAKQKIPFEEKPRLWLEYKGQKLRHEYQPDFLCFEQIILEIKAVKRLTGEHRAQLINYLKTTGKQLGLLVNFGAHPKAENERFVNQPSSRTS